MKKIFLKKSNEHTPIAIEEDKEVFLCLVPEYGWGSNKLKKELINLDFCLQYSATDAQKWYNSRIGIELRYIKGAIYYKDRAVLLITKDSNNNLHAFIDPTFENVHADLAANIRGQLPKIGIPKKNQTRLNPQQMYSRFCEPFAPTMDDYLEEVQKDIVAEFTVWYEDLVGTFSASDNYVIK